MRPFASVHCPFCVRSLSVLRAFIVHSVSVVEAFTVRTPCVQRPFCVWVYVEQKRNGNFLMTATVNGPVKWVTFQREY